MSNITLVSCNYGTPRLIEAMLKSWVATNSELGNKCLIMENSVDDDSIPFLESNKIPYVRNRGSVHYRGVEAALHLVNTRYMLLVDSDVLFVKSVKPCIDMFINEGARLAGKVEASRGGHNLHPRVHPWFCFIDVDFIRENSINFVDMKRVIATGSTGFYKNMPIAQMSGNMKYDVGATMCEDVLRAGGLVHNFSPENEAFFHLEGMSWRGDSEIPHLRTQHEECKAKFDKISREYEHINLSGYFEGR